MGTAYFYRFTIAGVAALGLFGSGCRPIAEQPIEERATLSDAAPEAAAAPAPKFAQCAAIRGNGELIFTHFGGMAKLVEELGPLDIVAGGSSASISSFMYESIALSPMVRNVHGELDASSGAKMALLLKSFVGVADAATQSKAASDFAAIIEVARAASKLSSGDPDEVAQASMFLLTLVSKASTDQDFRSKSLGIAYSAGLVGRLLDQGFIAQANQALRSPAVKDAILRQDVGAITNSPEVVAVLKKVKGFGAFDASDARIFFKAPIVSFPKFAGVLGVLASFYAGYGARGSEWGGKLANFVNRCAEGALGKTWRQHPIPECPAMFKDALFTYYSFAEKFPDKIRNRIDDQVGEGADEVFAIPTTSLTMRGSKIFENLEAGRAFHRANPDAPIPGNVFGHEANRSLFQSDIKHGYWVGNRPGLIAALRTGRDRRAGSITAAGRILIVGETWAQALATSPAEPGLSPAVNFPGNPDYVSLGGWSDLYPVQLLKDAGCENVHYLTRRGAQSRFAQGVARQLGVDDAMNQALFGLGPSVKSDFADALEERTTVLCSDWDTFGVRKTKDFFNTVFNHVYAALRSRFGKIARLSPPDSGTRTPLGFGRI